MLQSYAPTSDSSYGPPRHHYGPPKVKLSRYKIFNCRISQFIFSICSQSHYGPPRMSFGPPKQRSKYSIAPKAWHKPPIIIYAGVKPPVHVYKKPEGGWDSSSASSSASTSLTTTITDNNKDSSSSDGGRIVSSSSIGHDSYQSSSNNNNDISYGGSSSNNGEIYLPSASAPRPTIIKPLSQQSALKTIYVSSSVGSEGPFKTYLVTNSNPVQVQNIGYTNPRSSLPPVDLDTAASYKILSYLPPPKRLQTPIESQETFDSQPAAESRILPSNPESIFQDFRRSDEMSSVENASISVPLSLIVSTSSSVESAENNYST
jgi:hypothetical protein